MIIEEIFCCDFVILKNKGRLLQQKVSAEMIDRIETRNFFVAKVKEKQSHLSRYAMQLFGSLSSERKENIYQFFCG